MDKNKIYNMFKIFDNHTDDYLGAMFINIFSELPWCYRYFYNNEGNLEYKRSDYAFAREKYKFIHKIDSRKLLENLISEKGNTYEVFPYSANEFLIVGEHPAPFIMNITMDVDGEVTDTYNELYVKQGCVDEVFKEIVLKNCVFTEKDEIPQFGITSLVEGSTNLYTSWYDYDVKVDVNIEDNYNDDIPYQQLCDIISDEDRADLVLFYGEPGTGKTTLIKHLIKKYNQKSFIFMDGAILGGIPQDKLMSYFLENWDTVFILEDCEKILTDRSEGYNPVMPVLLNITDGIIGDVVKNKFICTFNSSINKIDKALLRKGRLSLKYEFKKLCKEKVNKILPNENKDMTLADIYYKEKENDFSKTQKNKIGF